MRRQITASLFLAMILTGQGGARAARASAVSQNPSQMSSDCEQLLAAWFNTVGGVFAEPSFRALSDTPAFSLMEDTLGELQDADCIDSGAADPETCARLYRIMETAVEGLHASRQYQAHVRTDARRAMQEAFAAVENGECLSAQELFGVQHSLLP